MPQELEKNYIPSMDKLEKVSDFSLESKVVLEKQWKSY